MGSLRLFAVLEDKKLVRNPYSDSGYTIAELTSGDRLDIQFTLLKRNAGTDHLIVPFEEVAASAYSLRVGVFLTSDGTQLAYQTSFTVVADNAYAREGVLALDTAAIATALTGATSSVVVTLEIEATIGANDHTVFRRTDVVLKEALIPSGTSSEQPGQTTATQEWVNAQMVPRDGTGSNPCNHILMKGDDGLPYVLTIRNGQTHVEAF